MHFPPQISTNGLISFDVSIPFFFNFPFPGFLANFYVIAPFWDDINTNNGGTISYEIHQGDSSAMQIVSAYVSAQTGEDFAGYWMMVVLWSEVPPFFATTSDVSCVSRGRQRCAQLPRDCGATAGGVVVLVTFV